MLRGFDRDLARFAKNAPLGSVLETFACSKSLSAFFEVRKFDFRPIGYFLLLLRGVFFELLGTESCESAWTRGEGEDGQDCSDSRFSKEDLHGIRLRGRKGAIAWSLLASSEFPKSLSKCPSKPRGRRGREGFYKQFPGCRARLLPGWRVRDSSEIR